MSLRRVLFLLFPWNKQNKFCSLSQSVKTTQQERILILECLWQFTGTKEGVCMRKTVYAQRTALEHQHGRRFIVLEHQYGRRDVMWGHVALLHTRRFIHVTFRLRDVPCEAQQFEHLRATCNIARTNWPPKRNLFTNGHPFTRGIFWRTVTLV